MCHLPSQMNTVRIVISILWVMSLPALAAPPETPEAFVRRVYARYRTFNDPGVPTDRPGGAAFYAAPLLDAFALDTKLADGQIGAIDYDPICSCQAYGPLRVKTVAITGATADAVKARVMFDNSLYHETVVLTLVRTPAGWRIADVGDRNRTSLMAVLRASNAQPTGPKMPKPN